MLLGFVLKALVFLYCCLVCMCGIFGFCNGNNKSFDCFSFFFIWFVFFTCKRKRKRARAFETWLIFNGIVCECIVYEIGGGLYVLNLGLVVIDCCGKKHHNGWFGLNPEILSEFYGIWFEIALDWISLSLCFYEPLWAFGFSISLFFFFNY